MKSHLNLKKTFTSKRTLRIIVPAAFVILLIASVLVMQLATAPRSNAPKPVSEKDYKQSLKAQVDNQDGSPVSGRNPSGQAQTSLASAAATPSGTGTRTENTASGLSGSSKQTASADVYGTTDEQRAKGVNAAGCFYDYGIPGQECMPASMANPDGSLSCSMVRMHFPQGLKVSGTDRFNLDTNKNGTACDSSDKA